MLPRCPDNRVFTIIIQSNFELFTEPASVHSNLLDFIVVWGQLVEELLDAVFLPDGVHVWDLVIRQSGEVEMDLKYNKH